MKQMEVVEKRVGNTLFFIKKFPAFTAANISGELSALLIPMIGSLSGAFGIKDEKGEPKNFMDIDLEEAAPYVSNAFAGISGDKCEKILKRLLVENRNISYENDHGEVKILNEEEANEVFCGEIQDMYLLAYEVIRVNFNGFFTKIGARFGNLRAIYNQMMAQTNPASQNTESSTVDNSVNSN